MDDSEEDELEGEEIEDELEELVNGMEDVVLDEVKFVCPDCNAIFAKKGFLENHRESKHKV